MTTLWLLLCTIILLKDFKDMENLKQEQKLDVVIFDYPNLIERPKLSHKQRKLVEDSAMRLKHYQETGKLLPSSIRKKRKPKKVKIEYTKGYFMINGQVRNWTKKNYENE